MVKTTKLDGGKRNLRSSEEETLFANLVETAAVPTFIATLKGDLTYVNRAFAEFLGYQPSEMIGLGVSAITDVEDGLAASAQITQLLADTLVAAPTVRRYRRKTGEAISSLLSLGTLLDERTGAIGYLTGQLIEVDHEKLSDAEIIATQSRLNPALEAAGQGVWDADIRGDRVLYSRVCLQHSPARGPG